MMKQITLAIGELQEQYKKIESPEQLPEIIKKQQEENLNTERALSTLSLIHIQIAEIESQIRDNEEEIKRYQQEMEEIQELKDQVLEAVSYTHLDVYKRQM